MRPLGPLENGSGSSLYGNLLSAQSLAPRVDGLLGHRETFPILASRRAERRELGDYRIFCKNTAISHATRDAAECRGRKTAKEGARALPRERDSILLFFYAERAPSSRLLVLVKYATIIGAVR